MKRKIFFVLSLCLILCMGFLVTGCADGKDGTNGVDGKSAYQIWIDAGHTGTEAEFLTWLQGTNGLDGKSAYQIWIDAGHTGTEAEFLTWLQGTNGKSAYELYIQYHPDYNKTEEEFMVDLTNGDLATKEDENPQGLEFYLLDDNTYAVSVGSAIYLSDIVIPETYKGKPVTKIVDEAFKDNDNIKSFVIGNNVKEIGQHAFKDCDHLVSVTLGESVETIASAAFSDCIRLVEVIDKSNYRELDDWDNEFHAIAVNRSYGGYVAKNALEVKTSGTTAIVNENNYVFYNDGYRNYLVDYVGTDAEITLPTSYNGGSYEMFKNAFAYNNKITSVTINGGVAEVVGFKKCENLETVRILADSVENIASWCFYQCANLETVVIGSNVHNIGIYAFGDCSSLTDVNFLDKSKNWRVGSIDIDISTGASAASEIKSYVSKEFYTVG